MMLLHKSRKELGEKLQEFLLGAISQSLSVLRGGCLISRKSLAVLVRVVLVVGDVIEVKVKCQSFVR